MTNVKNVPKMKEQKRKSDAPDKGPDSKMVKLVPVELDPKLMAEHVQRRMEWDRRNLFIKNIPRRMKDSEICALSPNIIAVRRKMDSLRFGWLTCASKEKADETFKMLSQLKLPGNKTLFVDRVRSKMNHDSPALTVSALELSVNGLQGSTTVEELSKIFPTAEQIELNTSSNTDCKYAVISFADLISAREAYNSHARFSVNGVEATVTYRVLGEPYNKLPEKDPNAKKGDAGIGGGRKLANAVVTKKSKGSAKSGTKSNKSTADVKTLSDGGAGSGDKSNGVSKSQKRKLRRKAKLAAEKAQNEQRSATKLSQQPLTPMQT